MNSSSSSCSWFRPCSVLLKRMLVPLSPYEFCNIMLTSKYCYVNRHLHEKVTLRPSMPLFILWIESFKTYSHMFPTRGPGFDPGSGHVGFVVDKVALGQVFSKYFGFPCQSSLHQLLHNHPHLSSGAGTIGHKWPQ
jgi:hypothetical protein